MSYDHQANQAKIDHYRNQQTIFAILSGVFFLVGTIILISIDFPLLSLLVISIPLSIVFVISLVFFGIYLRFDYRASMEIGEGVRAAQAEFYQALFSQITPQMSFPEDEHKDI